MEVPSTARVRIEACRIRHHVRARDNRWYHVPPAKHLGATNPGNGQDVRVYNAQDAVDTTGAALALIFTPVPTP